MVGAMKSGTTSLYTLLQLHPAVRVVGDKEADQLFRDEGVAALAREVAAHPEHACGEVSTAYMQRPLREPPVAAARRALSDGVRVVAVLRDPFERAVSHWRHWRQLGTEGSAAFERAVLDPAGEYVAFSRYHHQLAPWIDEFGSGAVHCIRLEDYQSDPVAIVRNLCAFLGVDPAPLVGLESQRVNAAESRLVARGPARALSRSPLYRRVIRPVVPAAAKRAVLRVAGGAGGREGAPHPVPDTRVRFFELVADDLAELHARWPHLQWAAPGGQGGTGR
ncbi:MAG TPA: sulfotransferase [Acidimicrobiales bacterium]|nr:sulfotransferase [Acidimicrobiales bacterium]